MQNKIKQSFHEAIEVLRQLQTDEVEQFLLNASQMIVQSLSSGGKVLIAGNGGSLCDADHLAEELTGQFRSKRAAIPAISLSQPGHLTCVGNDMGFDEVFARGVEALGSKGDVFIVLTTSGNSNNLLRAIEVAKDRGLTTIAFLGKSGGKLKGMCDAEVIVKGFAFSDRIQEAHMVLLHTLTELIEHRLFGI